MSDTPHPASGNAGRLTGPSETARRGAGNFTKMMVGRLAAHAVLVVSALVIPAVLGAENYGHYAAVMAVIAIVQVLSSSGLNMVEIRHLAPMWRSETREDAVVLGSTIWTTRALLSITAGTVAAIWFCFSGDLLSGFAVWLFLSVLAVIRSLFEATRGLFLSLGRVGTFVGLDLGRAALALAVVTIGFTLAGIDAVFLAFPGAMTLLLVITLALLVRVFPLQPGCFRWSALSPHLGFSAAAFVGTISHMVQLQFSIYLVAVYVARAEAGILAFTLQIFSFLRGLFQGGMASLMPILAEFDEGGDLDRLRRWGGMMMRYGAAASCVACVAWAFMGDLVLAALLPAEFAPVHHAATVILLAAAFSCCGGTCNAILLIRQRAWLAAFNGVVYATVAVVGVVLVMEHGLAVSLWICWIYALAAGIFFAGSYLALGLRARIWLPLRRTLLLIAPIAVAWLALNWDGSPIHRALAAAAFAAVYLLLATVLRLLPLREISEIRAALTRPHVER